jgi:hypothetical protein
MRELTKSLLSFTWAISLLGMKQAGDLLSQAARRSPDESHTSVDPVTRVAVSQLDGPFKGIFECGDNMQKGLVDMTFKTLDTGPSNFGNFNPIQSLTELMGKSVDTLRQATQSASRAKGPCEEKAGSGPQGDCSPKPAADTSGWGPIPRNPQ